MACRRMILPTWLVIVVLQYMPAPAPACTGLDKFPTLGQVALSAYLSLYSNVIDRQVLLFVANIISIRIHTDFWSQIS